MLRKYILGAWLPLVLLGLWLWGGGALASSADAVWPEAAGTNVQKSGALEVDASHMDRGYVMIRTSQPTNKGLKVRVSLGQWQLNYDLNSQGEYEAFPLQRGSGTYEISLFENVKGNKYAAGGKVKLNVKLRDENASFLVPNQYVSYELWTAAVQKSDEICTGGDAQSIFNQVSRFIAQEFEYDFVRAKTIQAGVLPDIDYCYDNRMGICQDLAAVTVCMLRVQGVPAKLQIGYADKYYHAWTSVIIDGKELFFDPTNAVGALNASRYSVEREY